MFRVLCCTLLILTLTAVAAFCLRGSRIRGSSPEEIENALNLSEEDGTIYLGIVVTDEATGAIRADGRGFRRCSDYLMDQPSYLLHSQDVWFLSARELPEGAYPNGRKRCEVFVTFNGHSVQLTDDPDLEPGEGMVRWVPGTGDTQISWAARRWGREKRVVDQGIYVAKLVLDELGKPLRLDEMPDRPAMSFSPVSSRGPWFADRMPDVCSYDWSPDGRAVVVETTGGALVTRDVWQPGNDRVIFESSGGDPVWSPDGRRVAFKFNDGFSSAILTVRSDGGDLRQIATDRPPERYVGHPVWSPDGQYLAYYQLNCRSSPVDRPVDTDVLAVDLAGGERRNITAQVGEQVIPIAWRSYIIR